MLLLQACRLINQLHANNIMSAYIKSYSFTFWIIDATHSDTAKDEDAPSLELVRDGENAVLLAFINLHLSCWNIEKNEETMSADIGKEKDGENEKGDKCRLEEPVVVELTESGWDTIDVVYLYTELS